MKNQSTPMNTDRIATQYSVLAISHDSTYLEESLCTRQGSFCREFFIAVTPRYAALRVRESGTHHRVAFGAEHVL
jgi:hypothetical protein